MTFKDRGSPVARWPLPQCCRPMTQSLCTHCPLQSGEQRFLKTMTFVCPHLPPAPLSKMAPNLNEDKINDLVYFARAGQAADLPATLAPYALIPRSHQRSRDPQKSSSAGDERRGDLFMASVSEYSSLCLDKYPYLVVAALKKKKKTACDDGEHHDSPFLADLFFGLVSLPAKLSRHPACCCFGSNKSLT